MKISTYIGIFALVINAMCVYFDHSAYMNAICVGLMIEMLLQRALRINNAV